MDLLSHGSVYRTRVHTKSQLKRLKRGSLFGTLLILESPIIIVANKTTIPNIRLENNNVFFNFLTLPNP